MEDFRYSYIVNSMNELIVMLDKITVRGVEDCKRMYDAIATAVGVNNYIKKKWEESQNGNQNGSSENDA